MLNKYRNYNIISHTYFVATFKRIVTFTVAGIFSEFGPLAKYENCLPYFRIGHDLLYMVQHYQNALKLSSLHLEINLQNIVKGLRITEFLNSWLRLGLSNGPNRVGVPHPLTCGRKQIQIVSNTRWWIRSKNSVTASVIHHRQNRLESNY